MQLSPVVKPHHSLEAMAAVLVAMAVATEVMVDAAGRAHQQDMKESQDPCADTVTCMVTMVILARGANQMEANPSTYTAAMPASTLHMSFVGGFERYF